jgi:Restriction endonuclease
VPRNPAPQRWICGYCGTECERPATKGQRPKWCGQQCAELGKRGARHTCEMCGVEYFGLGKRFCSKSCYGASCRKAYSTALVHVGPAPNRQRRFPASHTVASRGGVAWVGFVSGPCAWCGDWFTSTTTTFTERYCSVRCSTKFYRRSSREKHGRFWIAHRRRLAIYERDDWTCQLCFEPVDRDAEYLSDWAPSLDHIQPRSQGGTDEDANLRTAHRWCNAVLGDGSIHDLTVFAA